MLKPADEANLLNLVYEAKSEWSFLDYLFFHVVFVTRHVDRSLFMHSMLKNKFM